MKFACWLLSLLMLLPAAAAANTDYEWRFKVLLDDKEIGFHDFRVSDADGMRIVESEANFDVKILLVNVFRYRHQNREEWQGDCLVSIDAFTEANSRTYAVMGKRKASEFTINTAAEESTLPACIKTFAYWDPGFLQESRLLNSQTGNYEPVSISRVGEEKFVIQGESTPSVRYLLETAAGPVTLWYSVEDQRWLGLESVARGGRILKYEALQLPAVSG